MFDHLQISLIHGPNIPGSYAILFFAASDFTFITRQIHNWVLFLFWPNYFILSGAISSFLPLLPSSILDTFQPGGLIFWCHIFFVFLHSSWGSHGKYTGVVCHSLLQWIIFCQNSPLWPAHLGWPYMPWLIASLSYACPFAMTRSWCVKGAYKVEGILNPLQDWKQATWIRTQDRG